MTRRTVVGGLVAGTIAAVPMAAPAANFPGQVTFVPWYGQSWAMGFEAAPAINTRSRYPQLLTFNGGVRQQQSVAQNPTALRSFVAGVETNASKTAEFPIASVGETGAIAFGNALLELVKIENRLAPSAHDFRLLVSAPGEGLKSVEDLSGPPYLDRLLEQISHGHAIARASGKSFAVPAFTWLQGESEKGPAAYGPALEALRLAIQKHVRTLMPGHPPVKCLTWQRFPQSNNIADQVSAKSVYERQVLISDTFPNIICVNPGYQLEMASPAGHFSARGTGEIARAFAYAFKRSVIDGVAFKPLKPRTLIRDGRAAILDTTLERGRLVSDTAQLPAAGNLGFRLYSPLGAPLDLQTVVFKGSKIRITATANIPAGARLGYADIGTAILPPSERWRGNVRDNGADYPGGVNHWLVAFNIGFDS